MRDFQRSRFYRWEDYMKKNVIHEYENDLTFDDCKDLIAKVCRSYRVDVPKVVKTRSDANRSYYCSDHSIHLNARGHSYGVVLHEVTHTVCSGLGISDGHGPSFVGKYCDIMSRMFEIPLDTLLNSAKTFGLKVN